jgi:hypothetical protein
MNCPICHNELGENEALTAYYYTPKDWWVVMHLRREKEGSFNPLPSNLFNSMTEKYPKCEGWTEHCAKAGFQIQ